MWWFSHKIQFKWWKNLITLVMQNIHCISCNSCVQWPHFSFFLPDVLANDSFNNKLNNFCENWIFVYNQDIRWAENLYNSNGLMLLLNVVLFVTWLLISSAKLVISQLATKRYFKLSKPFGIKFMSTDKFPSVILMWYCLFFNDLVFVLWNMSHALMNMCIFSNILYMY